MICPHTTCKHGGRQDSHHKWWPKGWYKSALEKRFRNDPRNVAKICRCAHDLEHLKQPPRKPSDAEMRAWLERNR